MINRQRVLVAFVAILLGIAGVLFLLNGLGLTALAAAGTRYVAPNGNDAGDCSSYANRCRTVQRAVDVANSNDQILVATGVYTADADQPWVVDIRKSVTIRGGYNGNFSAWNPNAYPTTLDGEEQRWVVHIFGFGSGEITPTLEGLRLTRGSTDFDGGGIYASSAHSIISGCQVFSNRSGTDGGGIYLSDSANALLINNAVFSNTAGWAGGGILLDGSTSAVLTGNRVFSNVADSNGGGITLGSGSDNATLTGNEIYHNSAAYGGGGMNLWDSRNAVLVNNMVVENRLTSGGSDGTGVQLAGSSARLLHTTIARNSGGRGSGVSVVCLWSGDICNPSTVAMTNTILVSHTIGIEVREHSTATLEATLWGSGAWANGRDWDNWNGEGTIYTGTVAHNYRGLPAFVAPNAGDYHIGAGAAINRGVNAGVTSDMDGDPRPAPASTRPDLGADEFSQRSIYLPLVLRNRQ